MPALCFTAGIMKGPGICPTADARSNHGCEQLIINTELWFFKCPARTRKNGTLEEKKAIKKKPEIKLI